ncbi:MAG: hemolysin III family protein [Elusimicrobia bacterium]|nr:hemolysin III family protein [Elusimicrobiota bacterium]
MLKTLLADGERPQSIGEEIANSVSHGVGLLGALVATPFLLKTVARSGNTVVLIGTAVFAVTVILLYTASTLYHALAPNRAKRIFRMFDHGAIFLLIAGTYTPLTLGVLWGPWGWSILSVVWTLAIAGVFLKVFETVRHPKLSMALYLLMGWLILGAIGPLWGRLPHGGWAWLAAGGISYTLGIAFAVFDRLRYGHFIWHLFVLVGTFCHGVMVWRYAGIT